MQKIPKKSKEKEKNLGAIINWHPRKQVESEVCVYLFPVRRFMTKVKATDLISISLQSQFSHLQFSHAYNGHPIPYQPFMISAD